MAAMHEDDSPDLREVARILNDTFEVNKPDTISVVTKLSVLLASLRII